MTLTTKEQGLLADLKAQEELCIEKYAKYACDACDGELKNLFTTLQQNEQKHLDVLNQISGGQTPTLQSGGQGGNNTNCNCGCCPNDNKNDAYLCKDALSMEKHASSLYDISIFEFSDENLRNVLNTIQKQEQNHGEMLYKYMSSHNIYS